LSCLLTRPVACDGSGPPRSALREQTPIAVSELADQYLVRRITRASSSSPSHPTKGQLFSFGGLHGRLVGSTAVRFFDANGSGRLIPSAGAARHHPICPGPTPDPKSTAKPTDGIRKGSARGTPGRAPTRSPARIAARRRVAVILRVIRPGATRPPARLYFSGLRNGPRGSRWRR